MLRLDAERFGTAEYDEATGRRTAARSAAGSPGTASASAWSSRSSTIHPSPQHDLFLGSGDRLGAVLGGLAYGAIGMAHRGRASRRYRYHRLRFPDAVVVPGRAAQLGRDGVHRRGGVPRRALRAAALDRLDPTVANLIQAILYALTTRLGAPGRDRYLLVLALGIGLVGGWLTAWTGGIAAAFLGHAITRFAVFLCTGHTGQTKPRGREVEEIEKRRRAARGLARHRFAGAVTRWERPG